MGDVVESGRDETGARFVFSEAGRGEAAQVHAVIVAAAEGVPSDTFFVNDEDTIARQMERGLTIKACRGGLLGGILHVHFPSEEESHARRVGHARGAATVAHMDIAAVLPGERGYGLMRLLLAEAEERLRKTSPERVVHYATVHPENMPSRRSFEASGYMPVGRVTIHGTDPRIVYFKTAEFQPNSSGNSRSSTESPRVSIRVTRVVAGGQAGADRASLDVAIELGIPYEGWCPSGGWAEDLPDPPGLLDAYPNLRETPTVDPAERTQFNVRDSDATLIVRLPGSTSPGTDLTVETAARLGRPVLMTEGDVNEVSVWIGGLEPGITLNVAGPRESEQPGVYELTRGLLRAVLEPRSGQDG